MYKIKLCKSELKKLKALKKKEKNQRIYRRLQCVYLNHQGKENKDIADIIGVCVDTITDWIKLYQKKGLEGLCNLSFKGKRKSVINMHIENIKKDVKENSFSTLAELQDWIKEKYSVELEQSWLYRCCKKNSIFLTRKPV